VLLVQLARVSASLRCDLRACQHPRELVDARVARQLRELARHLRAIAGFHDPEVAVGMCGDLRQVRHAQHLPPLAQRLQHPPDRCCHRAANAGVDLVEHERRHVANFAGRNLDRERHARELAARCHAR